MKEYARKTKIIATLGPSSSSPEQIRQMILAGMNAARLNFSHGSYENHREVISNLRKVSNELDIPVTIIQDLQGPKVRVGDLPGGKVELIRDQLIHLSGKPVQQDIEGIIPIDYPHLDEEAQPGLKILLADGLFELEVVCVDNYGVKCVVKEGGWLQSRKGVNFPGLNLRLPSLTEKDLKDLDFGLSQGVDWISLSFVRSSEDVITLKKLISEKGYEKPVIAKIEKPQAIDHLEEIIGESHGIMVARGDLGVEMSPEKVPMLQKKIIELCNRKGVPVITATQMLESMIHDPLPTRAEASDVANAIIDGTDVIMLSGETAMGDHPVRVIEMMAKIAAEVESRIEFKTYPPEGDSNIMALSEAANRIVDVISPRAMIIFTSSGRSARYVAAERPKTPVYAVTRNTQVYHGLNLLWGIIPVYSDVSYDSIESMISHAEAITSQNHLAAKGEKILIMGGSREGKESNILKIHPVD